MQQRDDYRRNVVVNLRGYGQRVTDVFDAGFVDLPAVSFDGRHKCATYSFVRVIGEIHGSVVEQTNMRERHCNAVLVARFDNIVVAN